MIVINSFKKNYLRQMAEVKSFKENWNVWGKAARDKLGDNPSGQEIFDLVESLDIFFKKSEGASPRRSQSNLASIGNIFECFNQWFLNLLLWNTPIMALRFSKAYVPKIIRDCITVNIQNTHTNSETDIVIFTVPNYQMLKNVEDLNTHLTNNINGVDMVLLQCKTNWRDNAQVPMLWDIVYNSESNLDHVSVGINGVGPMILNSFKYAFVTMPTGKEPAPNTMPVKRVENLTGGNFWLKETKADVAANIKELPYRHFPRYYPEGIPNHIEKNLKDDKDHLFSFLNLNW